MTNLSMVVARNVQRLREDRAWSQKDLATALRRVGGEWSRQSLGMLESKGIRGERLSDLIVICTVLGVALDELLEGDDVVDLRGGGTMPLSQAQDALRGRGPKLAGASGGVKLASGVGDDDPEEVRRMAHRWSTSTSRLRQVTRDLSGQDSPTAYRDYLAGLALDTPRDEARAKRGHGTRKLGMLFFAYPSESAHHDPDPAEFQTWFKNLKAMTDGDD